jgi:alginate O-acetyltransferase complex protein AlgI
LSSLKAFFLSVFGMKGALYDFRVTSVLMQNSLIISAMLVCCTPLPKLIADKLSHKARFFAVYTPSRNALLLALSFISLVGQTYNPFLYFRF